MQSLRSLRSETSFSLCDRPRLAGKQIAPFRSLNVPKIRPQLGGPEFTVESATPRAQSHPAAVAASSRDWNAAARARTSAGSNRSPCSRRIWNRRT